LSLGAGISAVFSVSDFCCSVIDNAARNRVSRVRGELGPPGSL
jgi:hypothetical protein